MKKIEQIAILVSLALFVFFTMLTTIYLKHYQYSSKSAEEAVQLDIAQTYILLKTTE